MKQLIVLIIALVLFSCTYTTPDGRKYKLETNCSHGHWQREHHVELRKKPFAIVKTYEQVEYDDSTWYCDSYVQDTIWIK